MKRQWPHCKLKKVVFENIYFKTVERLGINGQVKYETIKSFILNLMIILVLKNL